MMSEKSPASWVRYTPFLSQYALPPWGSNTPTLNENSPPDRTGPAWAEAAGAPKNGAESDDNDAGADGSAAANGGARSSDHGLPLAGRVPTFQEIREQVPGQSLQRARRPVRGSFRAGRPMAGENVLAGGHCATGEDVPDQENARLECWSLSRFLALTGLHDASRYGRATVHQGQGNVFLFRYLQWASNTVVGHFPRSPAPGAPISWRGAGPRAAGRAPRSARRPPGSRRPCCPSRRRLRCRSPHLQPRR